ncbi:hypothetical protein [Streptomyces niveus]|uniref:hypothetical protein n=1 Tax=Streptomyces niveus TaxID=193462 RepID=UPI003428D7F7
MNHLPLAVADYLCLWRDLLRFPRLVLLNRAHSVASLAAIAVLCAVNLLVGHPASVAALYAVLVVCGPSAIVSAAGSVVHVLWVRGLIWADIDCEWCGDDPDDDGPDDALGPVEPADPHGLIREISAYLRDQHTLTPTR